MNELFQPAEERASQGPVASIIVPVHNALPYLERCLASIERHTAPGTYQLILVDDASDSPVPEFLAGLEGRAEVITLWPNGGFSKACNAGAARACANYLVFLNSDVEVAPGWLEALVGAADAHPEAGAIGVKLLYPDGTVQHGGVFTLEDHLNGNPFTAHLNHVGVAADDPAVNVGGPLQAVTAAAILIRKQAWEAVGGFDEAFYNGFEDVDLCLRLWRSGWGVLYDPQIALTHHESRSGDLRLAKKDENIRLLSARWAGVVAPDAKLDVRCGLSPHAGIPPRAPDPSDSPAQLADNALARTSAIVIGRDSLALMPATVNHLRGTLGVFDELIIVDDGSNDGSTRFLSILESRDARVKVIYGQGPQGWEWALGAALDAATGQCAWLVQPGVEPTQGCAPRLRRHFAVGEIGIVGPLTQDRTWFQDWTSHASGLRGQYASPNEAHHAVGRAYPGQAEDVPVVGGFCAMLPIETLRRLLDERQVGWDYCSIGLIASVVLRRAGRRVLVAKDCFVAWTGPEGDLLPSEDGLLEAERRLAEACGLSVPRAQLWGLDAPPTRLPAPLAA